MSWCTQTSAYSLLCVSRQTALSTCWVVNATAGAAGTMLHSRKRSPCGCRSSPTPRTSLKTGSLSRTSGVYLEAVFVGGDIAKQLPKVVSWCMLYTIWRHLSAAITGCVHVHVYITCLYLMFRIDNSAGQSLGPCCTLASSPGHSRHQYLITCKCKYGGGRPGKSGCVRCHPVD